MKILSLFANIGIAEARLNELEDAEVVVANELVPRRASLYQQIYPYSRMICGNILNPDTVSNVCRESMRRGVDVIMATPPCQGISTAGKMLDGDERNSLTVPVIRITEKLRPRYVLIENVPGYVSTRIEYSGESRLITDIIREHLGNEYHISINVVDMSDYGVPQTRKRTIVLLSRNDQPVWNLPAMYPHKVTMREAIGDIPVIDPFVKDLTPYEFHRLFPRYESRKKGSVGCFPMEHSADTCVQAGSRHAAYSDRRDGIRQPSRISACKERRDTRERLQEYLHAAEVGHACLYGHDGQQENIVTGKCASGQTVGARQGRKPNLFRPQSVDAV